jgi:hypothetical protein
MYTKGELLSKKCVVTFMALEKLIKRSQKLAKERLKQFAHSFLINFSTTVNVINSF